MINQVFKVCDSINDGRTVRDIQLSLTEEVGELATEVLVKYGKTYKAAGPDGILGESVDAILCLLDLIKVDNPNITENDIMEVVNTKLAKWQAKTS